MARSCILQVEDEEADVLLLQHAFRKADIRQPRAGGDPRTGGDGLSLRGRSVRRPGDVSAPGPGFAGSETAGQAGLDVLQWLREQAELKRTVVIALTSSNLPADIARAYECGVNLYAVKAADNQKRLEFAQHLKGGGWREQSVRHDAPTCEA